MTANQSRKSSLVTKVTVLAVVLLVYAAGITIAYTRSGHAIDCVNTSLSTRNAPSAKDAQAHIDEAQALAAFLVAIASPDQAERLNAFSVFKAAQNNYVKTLIADQKVRDKTPLGNC